MSPKDQQRLVKLTAELLEKELLSQPWLATAPKMGLGFCKYAVDAGEQAARKLGLRTKRRYGLVYDRATMHLVMVNHEWLELGKGLILDSCEPGMLTIATEAERNKVYRRDGACAPSRRGEGA